MSWEDDHQRGACTQCGKPGDQFILGGVFYLRCWDCYEKMRAAMDQQYVKAVLKVARTMYDSEYQLLVVREDMFTNLAQMHGFMAKDMHPKAKAVFAHTEDCLRLVQARGRVVIGLKRMLSETDAVIMHNLYAEYKAECDLLKEASELFDRNHKALLEHLFEEAGIEWPVQSEREDGSNNTATMLAETLAKPRRERP